MSTNRPWVTYDQAFDMLPKYERERLRDKHLPSPKSVLPTNLEQMTRETKAWLYRQRVAEDRRRTAQNMQKTYHEDL